MGAKRQRNVSSLVVTIVGNASVAARISSMKWRVPDGKGFKPYRAHIEAVTPPVGSALIVDMNADGVSLWNATPANRVQLPVGQSAGEQMSFDITHLRPGQFVTFDVDQIGATVASADITIQLDMVRL